MREDPELRLPPALETFGAALLARMREVQGERVDRRGRRRGGWLAHLSIGSLVSAVSVAMSIVIAGGAVLLLSHRSPSRGSAPAVGPLLSYPDPAGWSFRYPAAFHLDEERFSSTTTMRFVEVTVASFPMRDAVIVSSNGLSVSANAPLDPVGRLYQRAGSRSAFRRSPQPGRTFPLTAPGHRSACPRSPGHRCLPSATR